MSAARASVVTARVPVRAMAVACLALVAMVRPVATAEPRVVATVAPVAPFDVRLLAGEWFEVARWGSAWAHRRCVADTRFLFSLAGSRQLDAVRTCTTPTGVDVRGGRMTGPQDGSGVLRGRFVVRLFGWIPAAWAEYRVLASGPALEWLLIGDGERDRLAVWSRVVALDESAMAAAIAAGRAHGFDTTRLTLVAHPAGPGALSRTR